MDTLTAKKTRRSKKDVDGRVFTCDCGKSYLSFQALYTHRRSKHLDLIKFEENPKKKRGRPKGLKVSQAEYDPCQSLKNSPLGDLLKNWKSNDLALSCDDVFAEFLFECSKIRSRKDYNSIVTSIISLRDCINKYYKEIEDDGADALEGNYTERKMPALLPRISNVYILKFLPQCKPSYNKESEVKFILDFCEWLVNKNYTDLEISVIS